MKIVIVGAGAMGAIYAALLADSGNEVWVLDPWLEHTQAIMQHGLRIEGASGSRCVTSLHVASNASELPEAELFIIATKASSVVDAAKAIGPVLTRTAMVLTIQNGLGSGERLASHLDTGQLYIGVAEGFGASVKAPGHVQHTAMNKIRIGAFYSSHQSNIEPLVDVWRAAGFNVQSYPDIAQLIWEKFICNVAYSAPCTVFNLSVKELLAHKHAKSVSQQCALEAWEVAKAKQVTLSFDDPIEHITAFGIKVGNAKPSMLLDHLVKRRSELDAINGRVPVVAEEEGMEAPVNRTVSAIVRSREAGWL